ncbi:hypothetical protein [Halalkalibacterium halodurans]|uniref:hypothetical protein n=2 Tax=Halalkalibacterium halodurans TaxID=86665 RepID=UPI002AA99425|nr:hypothetical protein [Halalkalibacterium halodurans]MDY7221458.1 hypothetical protein [Halalkalibacterium halodurans]MDY7240697.1 hypothetical protein [Halalkalibacterium halodurans]
MDPNEQLTVLAKTYVDTRSPKTFEQIYHILKADWQPKFPKIAKSLWTTTHEVEALYEDTLMAVLEKYDGNREFLPLLVVSLKNRRADYYNKVQRLRKREMLTPGAFESTDRTLALTDAATFEIADEFNLEEHVIKKEEDQRQLISFLADPNRVDAKTTAIVNAFPNYESQTALARALGLDRKTIRQKLKSLAQNYDEEVMGELRLYFFA